VSDRWIPVLAATVGVISGLGGALIGGYISKETQQQQFENERQAALVDMRREVYSTYIQAVETFLQTVDATRQLQGGDLTPEQTRKLIEEEGIPALAAQAAVELVAEDGVREAAQDIDQAFDANTIEEEWDDLRRAFIDLANEELFPDE
jgi:CHASE1-domain containing sensor protein